MSQVMREEIEALEARLGRVERELWPAPAAPPRAPAAPSRAPAALMADARLAAAPRVELSLEDLLGGRVLAWAGGVAVLAGVAFLFAMAVSRGWIGEAERTLLAAGGALLLGALGIRVRETGGRTDAALAATAAAIAALLLTITVAAQVYDLIPAVLGVILAVAVGAVATALAIRWNARGIGALGLVGGLLAPVLAGAPAGDVATLALLWPAAAAATVVVLWQRWPWLSWAVALLPAVMWLPHVVDPHHGGAVAAALVLVAFGALNVSAAVGFELRTRATTLRVCAGLLLVLNALTIAGAGWPQLGEPWIVAVAVAHLALGIGALHARRVPRDLAVLAIAAGVILADVAVAVLLDGAPRAIAYAGGAVAAAVLARAGRDALVLGPALGGHLALAIAQSVMVPAGTGSASLLAVAAACLVAGRLAPDARWRTAVDATGLAVVAYALALTLDGPALAVAYAAEAAVLAALARRGGGVATYGAVAHAGLAFGHALAFEAPPDAVMHGLDGALPAAVALGASALAVLATSMTAAPLPRTRARGAAGVIVVYLATVLAVDAFPHDVAAGQLVVSALWALAGTGMAVAGLRRRIPEARRAGLALLLVALGKVALYDLAALPSLYRVSSCIVLGLLLLLVAFAWQRMRPSALAS